MKRSVADQIISSRLLVLQSKRLLLGSARRRHIRGEDSFSTRVERLRQEAEAAQHAYRSAVLNLGSPEDRDYWVVAYGRMIEVARTLATKLRQARTGLPPGESYELSTDIEVLEDIIADWSESMRKAMTPAVA